MSPSNGCRRRPLRSTAGFWPRSLCNAESPFSLRLPGSTAALPAKAATSVIPIVFMIGSDPVKLGLVSSLNHPGGNLTGVSYFDEEIAPKRLNLLHELIPTAKTIALLVNPANATAATEQTREMQDAVGHARLRLMVVKASNPIELEDAFATLVQQRIEALQLSVGAFFGNHVDQIVALATRGKIPTIYPWREFRGRRSNELRGEHPRCLPSGRRLCQRDCQEAQGRPNCRYSDQRSCNWC